MSKESLQKRLDNTDRQIKQVQNVYQQLLGRKQILQELLKEQEENNKKENPEKK